MYTHFQTLPKITSFSNPKIKELVKLRDRRERLKVGVSVIDGIREVKAAIDAGVLIKEAFVCPTLYQGQAQGDVESGILKDLKAQNVEVFEVTKDIFSKICFGDRAEGVLALGCPQLRMLADLKVKSIPLFMLVERVEKPGNLGAILRTVDAVGIDALLVSDQAVDVFNPNVIRASLGTVFSVAVIVETPEKILEFFKSKKVKVVAATPAAKKVYTAVDFCGGIAIAVGSEKDGLSDFWLNAADEKVVIPMKGKADSLNTSVSAALIAYEALRQRSEGHQGQSGVPKAGAFGRSEGHQGQSGVPKAGAFGRSEGQ